MPTRFGHKETNIWNIYITSQVLSMRAEFLSGNRKCFEESQELCEWFAFCIKDLRNHGIEWCGGDPYDDGDTKTNEIFDSSAWLRETQNRHDYYTLLSEIFNSSDQWFADFNGYCAYNLGHKLSNDKHSTWNKYNVGKIHFIRNGFLGRKQIFLELDDNATRNLVKWLAFCVRELMADGIEWRKRSNGKVEFCVTQVG